MLDYRLKLPQLSQPNLFSVLLIYIPNCLFHIFIQMPSGHLKYNMSKMSFLFSTRSMPCLVTSAAAFPAVKRRRLGVLLMSLTQLIPFLLFIFKLYHIYPQNIHHTCSLLSTSTAATLLQPALSPECWHVLLRVCLCTLLPPCNPSAYTAQ